MGRAPRLLLSLAIAWACCIGALGLLRSCSAALGGDGRAAHLVTGAAAACFALGALRARPLDVLARWGAALLAAAVLAAAPHAEALLSGAVVAAGDAWRADAVTLFLAALLAGAPFAALGAEVGARRPSLAVATTGAVAALALLDGPWIPLPAAQALALGAPLLAALGASRVPESAAEEPASAVAWLGGAIAGGAAALAFAELRLPLRSFVTGTPFDHAQIDGLLLALTALGAAIIGPVLRAAPAGAALGATVAAVGTSIAWRQLVVLSSPQAFEAHLRRFGAEPGSALGVDGPLWAALMVVTTGGVAALGTGALLDAALHAGGKRALVGIAMGFAAGCLAAVVLAEGGSRQAGSGVVFEGGLERLAWAATLGLAAAAALAPGRTGSTWTRAALRIPAAVVAAASVVLLPPVEFRPTSLFVTEARVAERHVVRAVRESIDGIALLVDEPGRRDRHELTRFQRVRLDRTSVTPAPDDAESTALALAFALSLRPAPATVLYLGPPIPEAVEVLHGARAGRIESAPRPATETAVALRFGAVELAAAGDDGLRCAPGRRGFDLVILPPEPVGVAAVAPRWTPQHLRALEASLSPTGLLVCFLDARTAPRALVERLAPGYLDGSPGRGIAVLADGLRAPWIAFFASAAAVPVSPRPPELGSPSAPRLAALPRSADSLAACILGGPQAPTLARSALAWLPAVAFDRELDRLRAPSASRPVETADDAEGLRAVLAWFEGANAGATGHRAGVRAWLQALVAMESTEWRISAFRSPAEQQPVPQEAIDALVASARAHPGFEPTRRAFRQTAFLLRLQSDVSRLLRFAESMRAADPGSWAASCEASWALRQLLAPEMALGLLEGAPPTEPEGREAVAIERSAVLSALDRGDDALAVLRREVTEMPTSAGLARALAETLAARGEKTEALTWARRAAELSQRAADEELVERLEGGEDR